MKTKHAFSVTSVLATAAGAASPAVSTAADVGTSTYRIQMARRECVANDQEDVEEAVARAELERITPPNAELLKLADRFPAPQEWYDE